MLSYSHFMRSEERQYWKLSFVQLWHNTIPGHLPHRPDDDRHGHPGRRLRRPHQLWQEEERVRGLGPGGSPLKIRQKNGITGKDKCQDMGIGGGGRTRMEGCEGEERSVGGDGEGGRGKRREGSPVGTCSYAATHPELPLTRNIATLQLSYLCNSLQKSTHYRLLVWHLALGRTILNYCKARCQTRSLYW